MIDEDDDEDEIDSNSAGSAGIRIAQEGVCSTRMTVTVLGPCMPVKSVACMSPVMLGPEMNVRWLGAFPPASNILSVTLS